MKGGEKGLGWPKMCRLLWHQRGLGFKVSGTLVTKKNKGAL